MVQTYQGPTYSILLGPVTNHLPNNGSTNDMVEDLDAEVKPWRTQIFAIGKLATDAAAIVDEHLVPCLGQEC